MFICRTQTRSRSSGQTYFTHRLVRSHRVSCKVRQQTLLNLGSHFPIPRQGSMATHPGVYCLRSNQTDWDEESLWRTYTLLPEVEAVFRSLRKSLHSRSELVAGEQVGVSEGVAGGVGPDEGAGEQVRQAASQAEVVCYRHREDGVDFGADPCVAGAPGGWGHRHSADRVVEGIGPGGQPEGVEFQE